MHSTIYQFSAKNIKGQEISLESYKGKVVLIVNTASECGFTPQYTGLEELYKKHKENLVVLGFPCNQFGGQEPGSEESIESNCLVNYGVTFPMFSKVEVNGDDAHSLFTFLKSEKGSLIGKNIKWNFTKFLINKEGEVIGRYLPTTKPESIEKDVVKLF